MITKQLLSIIAIASFVVSVIAVYYSIESSENEKNTNKQLAIMLLKINSIEEKNELVKNLDLDDPYTLLNLGIISSNEFQVEDGLFWFNKALAHNPK